MVTKLQRMNPALAAVLAAIVTALGAYIVNRRINSGSVGYSDASTVFTAAKEQMDLGAQLREELRREVAELQGQLDEMRTQIGVLTDVNDRLRVELAASNRLNADLRLEIERLRTANDALAAEIRELRARLS